ncbi:GPP34 family phosphoprotein [Streptomyces sp. TS71-3]|uniref:GOLPH3/VPS74 family protein n=1 Tax=Streptomyces sp. TS71-3 TaxID=2733862 RepID=UPI001B122750|nr:GPP34 family phosphoprotein [Streptomyces sp. TS71-3]GHJ41732.1 hypothetical protein Sm713_73410 [Streptomyces sp. TS71-3]
MSLATLTVPEQMLLLLLDPASGKPRARERFVNYAVTGAALAELEAAGRIVVHRGRIAPAGSGPLGDPLLDMAFGRFRSGKRPRTVRWIHRNADAIGEACALSLRERGLVGIEKRRALGLFPRHRYPLQGPDVITPLVEELRAAAEHGFPGPRHQVLAALVSALRITPRVMPGSSRGVRKTMRSLAGSVWPAHVVRRMVRAESSGDA